MKTRLSGKKLTVLVCNNEVEIPAQRGVAIKAHCTDCSGGSPTEVRECPNTQCPLYHFRGYIRWSKDDKNGDFDSETPLGSE